MLAEAGALLWLLNCFGLLTDRHFLGKDGTEAFEDVGHSDEARALLPGLLVGEFEKDGVC
jgi:hypothetical protein